MFFFSIYILVFQQTGEFLITAYYLKDFCYKSATELFDVFKLVDVCLTAK